MSVKTLRPYQKECLDELIRLSKETVDPMLVNASMGAGKSLIIAEFLKYIESLGKRALCLTLNSGLIRQNASTYELQGGHSSIFCASLGQKMFDEPVVFASPQSIASALKQKKGVRDVPFNFIVIDEAHNVNYTQKHTMYMRIIHHFGYLAQRDDFNFQVIGLTGTPFRGKGVPLVEEGSFFKRQIGNITTSWLIDQGYLVPPKWEYPASEAYDFSELQVLPNGQFNKKQLGEIVSKQERLTHHIMTEVTALSRRRKGVIIFASTVRHCYECASSLPSDSTEVITAKTPHELREEIVNKARAGQIKFLINVNVLTVGVDIPNFDTIVFVRPTESLVLYTQALGRGLRLSHRKANCLILDYAGNLDRHGGVDNPILNKGLRQFAKNNPSYDVPCDKCHTLNKDTARRCIGGTKRKRCSHYFEWKRCPKCDVKNDRVSRHCRKCEEELVDPNAKLSQEIALMKPARYRVTSMKVILYNNPQGTGKNLKVTYRIIESGLEIEKENQKQLIELYPLVSDEGRKRAFYQFIVHHTNPSPLARDAQITQEKAISFIDGAQFATPSYLDCVEIGSSLKIKERVFDASVSFTECLSDKEVKVLAAFPTYGIEPKSLFYELYCYEESLGYFKTTRKYKGVTPACHHKLYREIPAAQELNTNLRFEESIYQLRNKLSYQNLKPKKVIVDYRREVIEIPAQEWGPNGRRGNVLIDHTHQPWNMVHYAPTNQVYLFEFDLISTFSYGYHTASSHLAVSSDEETLLNSGDIKQVSLYKRGHYWHISHWHLPNGIKKVTQHHHRRFP